nr:hypothetical protein [uncultured Oscillibacter sp.]
MEGPAKNRKNTKGEEEQKAVPDHDGKNVAGGPYVPYAGRDYGKCGGRSGEDEITILHRQVDGRTQQLRLMQEQRFGASSE